MRALAAWLEIDVSERAWPEPVAAAEFSYIASGLLAGQPHRSAPTEPVGTSIRVRPRSRSSDVTAVDVHYLAGDERSRLQQQDAVDRAAATSLPLVKAASAAGTQESARSTSVVVIVTMCPSRLGSMQAATGWVR